MVDIGYRNLGLDLGNTQGLELEIGHGPGGVLGEGLVDANADFIAGRQCPFNDMVVKYLVTD